jgi:hypothetical protein
MLNIQQQYLEEYLVDACGAQPLDSSCAGATR